MNFCTNGNFYILIFTRHKIWSEFTGDIYTYIGVYTCKNHPFLVFEFQRRTPDLRDFRVRLV